jgi:truncated hemoglobin YjbI
MTVTVRAASYEAAAHQAAALEAQGITCVIEVSDTMAHNWPSVVAYMNAATAGLQEAIEGYGNAAVMLRYGGDVAGAAELEEVVEELGHTMASYRPDPDEGGCWSGA